MIEIGRTIISIDVIKEYFLCELVRCKGACCIEGESGAPVTYDEGEKIKSEFHILKPILSDDHIQTIEEQGFSIIDKDGDLVTPLVNNRQCAYSFYDGQGILKCCIEKTYSEGKISFRKPVSCHLFPIRITSYKRFDAVNYHQIESCRSGRECGKANKLPLYRFLKEALIRKYGEEWYEDLEAAADYVKLNKSSGLKDLI